MGKEMNKTRFKKITCLMLVIFILLPVTVIYAEKIEHRVVIITNVPLTAEVIDEISIYASRVHLVFEQINALAITVTKKNLELLEQLPFIETIESDKQRFIPTRKEPMADLPPDFTDGLSTWNLDMIDIVAGPGFDVRSVVQDGSGTYVAVLDTGLIRTWRNYFPEARIAAEYAKTFAGGGNEAGYVHSKPKNKWEHDTYSHGTHVTSTILGYSFYGLPVTGVAPMTTVIPVKVLNNAGWGWSSVITAGILYIAELKEGPLENSPVIINLSLGGPELDPAEEAAIDYAIGKGVIIVASAGNEGEEGMGYPGAYEPVISVGACGWINEWSQLGWWNNMDISEPTAPAEVYMADYSSKELTGQDLDVVAPGTWVVGPFQLQQGQLSYYYLGGTSMAAPHVSGLAALMLEKKADMTQAQIEIILESTALDLPSYDPVYDGSGLIQAGNAITAVP